jgi:hypothetical protein
MEPVQIWIDLLAAGLAPGEVTMLGLGGGDTAAFAFRLALILGARVYVINGTGPAVDELAADPVWSTPALKLTSLPKTLADALALEALLPTTATLPSGIDLNTLGALVHTAYLRENLYSEIDPVRKKWAELREDLRESNRDQIAAAVRILASEGYAVTSETEADGATSVKLSSEERERMAEREHARWNLERLRSGWRYGPKKNVAEKRTPWLVPWTQLPDDIKRYDRDAIDNYAKILGAAKLAIVRRSERS